MCHPCSQGVKKQYLNFFTAAIDHRLTTLFVTRHLYRHNFIYKTLAQRYLMIGLEICLGLEAFFEVLSIVILFLSSKDSVLLNCLTLTLSEFDTLKNTTLWTQDWLLSRLFGNILHESWSKFYLTTLMTFEDRNKRSRFWYAVLKEWIFENLWGYLLGNYPN